jgi:hypothetical protein
MLTTLALIALAQYPQHRIFEQPNLRRLNARAEPTYLEFLPESGAGIPAISHHNTALCDALAAEEPDWNVPVDGGAGSFCLGGDGLSVPGSEVTFATVGTPATIETPVCPSGLDCLAATGQPVRALHATSGILYTQATQSRAQGTGPRTACHWASADNSGVFVDTLRAGSLLVLTNSGQGGVFGVQVTGTPSNVLVYGPSIGVGTSGGFNFFCGVYGVDKKATAYVNGAAGTPSAVVDITATSYQPYLRIFGTSYTSHLGAFYVDKELSASQIAAIARRVLADQPKAVIQGGKSFVDLTYSRTGSMFCSKADNTGSIIPANRPCIARNGILVEGAATNLVLRSQEINSAPWNTASSTVTANYGIAPDSTKTAERVVPVVAGPYQPIAPVGAALTFSIFIKGTSGSGVVCPYLYNGTLADIDATACAYNPDTYTRCVVSSADTNVIEFGLSAVERASCVPTPFFDVLAWGAQVETGSVATSYIPTTSAAATRGAVGPPYLAHGQGIFDRGCISSTLNSVVPTLGVLSLADTTTLRQGIGVSGGNVLGYVGGSSVASVAVPAAGEHRYIFSWQPSGSLLSIDGVGAVGTAGTPATTNRLYLGGTSTAQPGWYSKIQYDTRPTRCR